MDSRYDQAPEVASDNLPEVHYPPEGPEVSAQHLQPPQTPGTLATKPEYSGYQQGYGPGGETPTVASTYGYSQQSPYPGQYSEVTEQQRPSKGAVFGCSRLVLVLSIIIAILSAAVIALAATTGVETKRAQNAEGKLALNSTNSSSFDSLDRGCSSNPSGVSGTTYSSQFFFKPAYTIWCNSDTPNNPLQSLFVANFDDCMDACASYSYYIPSDFVNGSSSNQTCAGVSFVPLWTNRTAAVTGTAPGNCYLKPGPQNKTALFSPYIGTECHAAIINKS